MATIDVYELVQKEAKTFTFTVVDHAGTPVNLTTATVTLYLKSNIDSGTLYTIVDGSFDKSLGATGVVSCDISDTMLNRAGQIYGVFKVYGSAASIDKYVFQIQLLSNQD